MLKKLPGGVALRCDRISCHKEPRRPDCVENYVFFLRTIWEALGELEAEEASDRHLEVRSQKLQRLLAKMQF